MTPADTRAPEVRGGQVWEAPWPYCWSEFVVYLGDSRFVLTCDPRHERGSVAVERDPSVGGVWQKADLETYFAENGWECKGQVHDLILADIETVSAMTGRAPEELAAVRAAKGEKG